MAASVERSVVARGTSSVKVKTMPTRHEPELITLEMAPETALLRPFNRAGLQGAP